MDVLHIPGKLFLLLDGGVVSDWVGLRGWSGILAEHAVRD